MAQCKVQWRALRKWVMYVRVLRAACSTHPIFLLLITLIMFVDQYELWRFTSSQVGTNILYTTMQP